MILGLLLLSPASLTFEAHAEPVASIVDRLGKASNTPLLCAPEVGRRRVTAFIKDVPEQEIRNRLAQVTDTEWVQTQKGLRLEATPRIRSAQAKRRRELRVAWIRSLLSKHPRLEAKPWDAPAILKTLQDRKDLQDKNRQGRISRVSYVPVSPALRAVNRLLDGLNPELLAEIEWGEKRVFTTRTSGRRVVALPESARSVARSFNAEYNTLQEVLLAHPKLGEEIEVSSPSGSGQKLTDPLAAEATDVTLTVSRDPFKSDLYFNVFLSSASGTIVNGATFTLSDVWYPSGPMQGKAGELLSQLKDIPVEMSPEAQAKARFYSRKPPKLLSEAPPAVREPERFEPLDLLYTDSLRAVAEAKRWNVIVQMSDLDSLRFGEIEIKNASNLRSLFDRTGQNVKIGDGWLVIETKDSFETDRATLDRGVLGTYLRSILDSGFNSFAYYTPVLRATGGLINHPLAESVVDYLPIDRLSGAGMMMLEELPLLDHFTAVSQRKVVSDLTPVQRAALERYLYHGNGRFQGKTKEGIPIFDRIEFIPNIGFPNGLPKDLVFDLKVKAEDVAYQAPDPGVPYAAHNPKLPILLALAPNLPPDGQPARYRVGKQTEFEFSIDYLGQLSLSGVLREESTDLSQPAVVFSQLPEWFRQKVEAVRKGIS